MKRLCVAAFTAVMGVSAPAWAADPMQVLFGTQPRYPQISIGVCSSLIVDGVSYGIPCDPGLEPAMTFRNAAGLLTQVSPSTPLPTTGGGTSTGTAAATVAGNAYEPPINFAVSTTAVTVGTAGTYRTLAFQPMGAPICYTFGSGTLVAPTAGGVCAVGSYVAAGLIVTYAAAVPNTALRAISSGSAILWFQVQS